MDLRALIGKLVIYLIVDRVWLKKTRSFPPPMLHFSRYSIIGKRSWGAGGVNNWCKVPDISCMSNCAVNTKFQLPHDTSRKMDVVWLSIHTKNAKNTKLLSRRYADPCHAQTRAALLASSLYARVSLLVEEIGPRRSPLWGRLVTRGI